MSEFNSAFEAAFAKALSDAELKAKEEGKPLSKFAKKALRKKVEAELSPAQAIVAVAAAPVVSESNVAIEAFFGTLEDELMGDKLSAMNEMVALREKGFALIAKSKTFNLRDAEFRANKDAWHWRNDQIKDAERAIFNELGTKGEKSAALRKAFTELQDAYHQNGDTFKSAKFTQLCLNYINSVPRMKELHEKNLERAAASVANFEAEKAEQERMYREGAECLELANMIAEENGWPKTEKKGGGK